MGLQAVTGWMGMGSLSWSILRVGLIWLALQGTGSLLKRIPAVSRHFGLLPSVAAGMLFYMALVLALSLAGLLTRSAVALSVAAGAITGVHSLIGGLRSLKLDNRLGRGHLLLVIPFIAAAYIVATDAMLAGRPEINFNDTQVTYLVQPDRWLDSGRMYFLDETTFSAFPLTSEMLLVLPCSLAGDMLDQLVLGQLFCLSMVLALVLVCMHLLSFGPGWYQAGLTSVMGASTILLWSHLAKPDAFALFFVTVALTLLLRQLRDSDSPLDLSPYIVMGMALSTKYTAYLSLIPFGAMYLMLLWDRRPGPGFVLGSLAFMGLLPAAFAVRTAVHTGSPFFPFSPFPSLLRARWRMPDVELTYAVFNDRSSHFFPSVGFFQNIYHYFGVWNSSIFLAAGGFLLTLGKSLKNRTTLIIAGILLYACASLVLFYPAWWGAKYGILLIPFTALLGMYMLREAKRGLAVATVIALAVYLIYESPLSPTEHWGLDFRTDLAVSYLSEEWQDEGNDFLEPQPELGVTLWMNDHLPEGSTILSFYVKKRYLSEHRWIVACRYPPAARLFLENSLSEEMEIMRELGVDYLVLVTGNPAPFDDEDAVEIFSHIGPGRLLEPVAMIDGHVVLRYSPENIRE